MYATHDLFAVLFHGAQDRIGTNEGGCLWLAPDVADTMDWGELVLAHLDGSKPPCGVYPLYSNTEYKQGQHPAWRWVVNWGCSDLDFDDYGAARNLANLLEMGGVNAWVERSRSKGFHVWSFASEPVPAAAMRGAFLAAHQLLGIVAKEVNPKQVELAAGGAGNYVRLPYPYGWEDTQRQVMLENGLVSIPLAEFVEQAWEQRSPAAAYITLAAKWKPPVKSGASINGPTPALDEQMVNAMPREPYLAWRYGPREGRDRSNSLARLAHMLREAGWKIEPTLAAVTEADTRWGKFFDRPDGAEQLAKIVEGAFR